MDTNSSTNFDRISSALPYESNKEYHSAAGINTNADVDEPKTGGPAIADPDQEDRQVGKEDDAPAEDPSAPTTTEEEPTKKGLITAGRVTTIAVGGIIGYLAAPFIGLSRLTSTGAGIGIGLLIQWLAAPKADATATPVEEENSNVKGKSARVGNPEGARCWKMVGGRRVMGTIDSTGNCYVGRGSRARQRGFGKYGAPSEFMA